MTLEQRAVAYNNAFRTSPASWLRVVREQDRDVLYGTWVIGAAYGNETDYYGAHPHGYLRRLMAMFPDAGKGDVLHAFSGSLPPGDYTRLDLRPEVSGKRRDGTTWKVRPDVVGSVYDVGTLLAGRSFGLVTADPPYSEQDAEQYGTPGVDRLKATEALAAVARPSAHLAWLDTTWPMHNKRRWVTVGRITVVRSTNHRVRMVTLLERVA